MSNLPRIDETGALSYTDSRGLTASSYVPTTYTATDGTVTEVQPTLPLPSTDWMMETRRGNIPGVRIVQKFGAQLAITTSYTPVTSSAVYQTPQVSGATTLRIKAGNANDAAAGTGAQEVTLQGLNEQGEFVEESIATAGASASSATTTTWLRLFRYWVSASGSYATAAVDSHAAAIVIETTGGTEWGSIDATGTAKGQSQVAVFTTSATQTAYIVGFYLTTGDGKPVDFLLYKRENILETAAPYSAKRAVIELVGIDGVASRNLNFGLGSFPPLCDFGWMAKGATTPNVTVDFEIAIFE